LLPTGHALIDAGALVIAIRCARNLGDTANLATVNAANLAIRPAHALDIIQALIFGLEFGGNIYQFHNARILAEGEFCVKYIIADEVVCFHTDLKVLILEGLAVRRGE
jgi:hypothetical protein